MGKLKCGCIRADYRNSREVRKGFVEPGFIISYCDKHDPKKGNKSLVTNGSRHGNYMAPAKTKKVFTGTSDDRRSLIVEMLQEWAQECRAIGTVKKGLNNAQRKAIAELGIETLRVAQYFK
jgi:hypothetical protein